MKNPKSTPFQPETDSADYQSFLEMMREFECDMMEPDDFIHVGPDVSLYDIEEMMDEECD